MVFFRKFYMGHHTPTPSSSVWTCKKTFTIFLKRLYLLYKKINTISGVSKNLWGYERKLFNFFGKFGIGRPLDRKRYKIEKIFVRTLDVETKVLQLCLPSYLHIYNYLTEKLKIRSGAISRPWKWGQPKMAFSYYYL